MSSKRFRIALSFAGEHRPFVAQVAEILAAQLGKDKILYDKYYEAEFAHADLAWDLPQLYHEQTDLIVVIFCPGYLGKEWCGLEWRAIYGLIKHDLAKTVMLSRFEKAEGRGLYGLAGFVELDDKTPEQFAQLILQRLARHDGTGSGPGHSSFTTPPSNLPGGYIGQIFLGREDFLKELHASLEKKTHATAITQRQRVATGIGGLGGLGKTHAAVEYAHRHRHHYSALLFVNGDSPERLDSGLAALCEVLPIADARALPPEQAARTAAVLKWLTTHHDWLLIVDNVDDEAAALALTAYFDQLHHGHVLITSRLHGFSRQVATLDLSVLSDADATSLLLQLTNDERRTAADDEAQALALARLMEGLPLALHQAAGYINEQRITFAQYLARYEQEAAGLLEWFSTLTIPYAGPEILAPRPVLITWKTSFDRLSPEARFWLLVFSHFAPDPIPEFLFEDAPDTSPEVKSIHRAALNALAQAEKFSLLTRYDEPPRFKLHRLVQHVTRLTATAEECSAALEVGFQLIAGDRLGEPQDVRTWPRWTPLQPHALALCQHAPDETAPQRLTLLLGNLSVLLSAKALHAQSEPLMRRALKIDEDIRGPEDPNVASHLSNLAQLLQATNRLGEAEPLIRRALQIDEASHGSEHPKVAIRLNNLASLLHATNRLVEAEPLMRRALKIDEASYGPEHPDVAIRLSNLAHLLHATNRLAEAEPLMRRALKIDEASYGPEHPDVAIRLSNLATLLQATNRLGEAEPLIRRALKIDEASYGPEHPYVAIRLNNLAQLFQATNRLGEAEPLIRRALKIDETSYGPEHPKVARDFNNLASLLQATNRLVEAEPLMRRALKIDEASYGLDHPDVAIDLNNLAGLLQATNRLGEAEPLMRRALLIDETSYGSEHPTVAIRLSNLAHLLHATNRLVEAEPLMRRALKIDEASYGPEHPDVARDLCNLAQLLHATNRLGEAEPLMRRALQIDEASYGPEHPKVATDLSNLAVLLQDTNRLAEAESLMRRALKIDEASYGQEHPRVAIRLNNLATLLQDTNRLVEAEPLMRRALQIDEASYGSEHSDVAIRLNNLAGLLYATNRLAEAEPLMARALGILVRSLGLEHPNSQTILGNYIALLQALKLPEAEIRQRVRGAVG